MPPRDFSVADVKRLVGPKREVDVMDTHTQKAITMTMAEWVKYYQSLPRKRVLNIISLEFSCTKMADLVEPPTVVSQDSTKCIVLYGLPPHHTRMCFRDTQFTTRSV